MSMVKETNALIHNIAVMMEEYDEDQFKLYSLTVLSQIALSLAVIADKMTEDEKHEQSA